MSCDDEDPCTQDVCAIDGTCEHTLQPEFDGLACRLAQLLNATSQVRLKRPQVLLLARLQRLVDEARRQGPQPASRRLNRARLTVDRLLLSLLSNRSVGRASYSVIKQRAAELEGQIVSLRAELQALSRLQRARR